MSQEFFIFVVMVGVFAAGTFALKWPVAVSMLLASVAGALAGGFGVPIRHLVEGTFGYVDTILTIATAMIFMNAFKDSGGLEALSAATIRRFHKIPGLLLVLLTFVVMFPGMITGSSSASVLTAGAVVAPMFAALGIPGVEAAALIAMAGILGMIAPPVNIPAMIIGGGIDMPYVGFEIPLLLLTVPLAVFSAFYFGYRFVKKTDISAVVRTLDTKTLDQYGGFRLFSPVLIVLILMVLDKALPKIFNLGMPLIFVLSTIPAYFTGKRFNILNSAKTAIEQALPVLGILVGVGMFIQIMTLTGVRGFIVVNALSVPPALLYLAIAISIPLFGAVSSFGASSVLGVPFLLALLGRDQIITAASLSLIAALGDFMPPTALSAIFAAQVVGLDGYGKTLKKLVIPSLILIVWALVFIIFSKQIRTLY
ncbi:MAG: TRAP transporter large permease subunit [Spirochaetia bacterium]|nr:TRAP transporter large permease subunit [Spirochaetia bacterium]